MKIRSLVLLLLSLAVVANASPRTAEGVASGPVVVLIQGASGGLSLLHDGQQVRAWDFPGPFVCAVVLAGPLDTVAWDGDPSLIVGAGKDPAATARRLVTGDPAPRWVVVNADGSTEVRKAPAGEETYDAAAAASAEE